MRKTKIVATIGPSSCTKTKIVELIDAGVDVFRFNMKHNTLEWHSEHMEWVQYIAHKKKTRVGILIDLQGPEVRISGISDEGMTLKKDETFKFVKIDQEGVQLDHPEVFRLLTPGQTIFADDGLLEFKVIRHSNDWALVKVIEGGVLRNRKTTNFPGITLDFPALVKQDFEHLSLTAKHHVDFVALSFVRSVDDIQTLKKELNRLKVDCKIIAKIEHPEAIHNFDEILLGSDGVMVARGDLGIEYPMEEVPSLQKMIVKKAREEGRPVIIATQMLESMVDNIRPTRAEVSDVANAVYDSADALMLSGESASGKHPIRTVSTMNKIMSKVDSTIIELPQINVNYKQGGQTAAVVAAAYQLMKTGYTGVCDLDAFVVLTETGRTVQYLSRLRPKLPIIALSQNEKTLDQLKLSWGVVPVYFKYSKRTRLDTRNAVTHLSSLGIIEKGKNVVMIYGQTLGKPGITSVVRVQLVE